MKKSRVSHRQIAEGAGVSSATVSLALSNHPRISPATRRKVKDMAAKMGYVPNADLARVMRAMQQRNPSPPTIALVTNRELPSPWKREIYLKKFHDAITERATELGYRIEEFWVKAPKMTPRRLSQIWETRHIAGLIIPPAFEAGKRLPFRIDSLATVTHGRVYWSPKLHRVQKDDNYNTMLALKRLRKAGYRRIGLAMFGGEDAISGHETVSAYSYYVFTERIPSVIPPFLVDGYALGTFWEWFEEHRPDVILSNFPDLLEEIRDAGCKVPEDVGFACFGVLPEQKDLAGIDVNARHLDRALVDAVVSQCLINERGIPEVPRATLIEGFWKPGSTIRSDGRQRG